MPQASSSARAVRAHFDKLWTHEAVSLNQERLRAYRRVWRAPPKRRATGDLLKVLGKGFGETTAARSRTAHAPSYWRDTITGYVQDMTEQIVDEVTGWSDRYEWYSCGPNKYSPGDRILLFDNSERRLHLRVVQVKDTTELPSSTPDGRHFTAYREVGWYRTRRATVSLFKELADLGLDVRANRWRRRSSVKADLFERVLKACFARRRVP
jgi:hypothetical protein